MKQTILAVAIALSITACNDANQTQTSSISKPSEATQAAIASETARINTWFETKYEENLLRSPIKLAFEGRDERKGDLDDFSMTAYEANLAKTKADLAELQSTFNYDLLSEDAKISYDLWVYMAEEEIDGDKYRYNNYVFDQMNAIHSFFPQLLISFTPVTTLDDMQAYISRLEKVGKALNQLVDNSMLVAEKGVRPPYFAFESVIAESQKIISGQPFTEGDDSALWADAKTKLDGLLEAETIDAEQHASLLSQAKTALLNSVQPAFERLIEWQELDRKNASAQAQGVSSLPDGEDFYNYMLRGNTTTNMTADEIHALGLKEVERLRQEMEAVKAEFGFDESLQKFFVFLRENKDDRRLYYPDTDEGRQGYIDDSTAAINTIKSVLPDYFGILPKADMVVKRVESFREQPGAAQHYFPSSPDGKRPGVYYAHLSDMTAMPKRELEVIAYHEGLPGHHMQIAIAQELEGVPTFRSRVNFTAYVEGWALYSEILAKEMPGTFQDPLSDFGRLGSEIWRAIRLVLDTGLHAKGWSEQEAINYFTQNSAITLEQAKSEVRRYMVLPGQATSYKIGMIKIQELRTRAEQALGDEFDIRAFHDVILGGGALPLALLERRVDSWISSFGSRN